MSNRPEYSKKILKMLSRKPALPVEALAQNLTQKDAKYAISRSLKGLQDAGLVERHHSGQKEYARLTKGGRKKAYSAALDDDTVLVNPSWDGNWRIILLDLPEDRKGERDGLRYLLKKAGFVCIKNSVWVSPLPYEHLFANIKKDLGLTTEIMIFVTDTLDTETEQEFFSLVK